MTVKNNATHKVANVIPGSPAYYAGLEPGDIILEINGHELKDIFDYYYFSDEEDPVLTIVDEEGIVHEVEIEKYEGEDLGVTFENGLLDDYRSCSNACMFCFIDQMPPGMRDTLYFKDDDTRLSFLQGNYVTLTNMKEEELDRLIAYHLDPINISVQATDPDVRRKMLNNRFAGDILSKIKKLHDADIRMNSQIVLCKGVNDGEILEKSIRELIAFYPNMESLSVVPVGLSKFREGLYPLEPFTKEEACEVLDTIERWQDFAVSKYGHPFVQAGDEWYLLAQRPLPEADRYDGYNQLENGVGMLRLLMDEFAEGLEESECRDEKEHYLSIATGKLAAPYIRKLTEDLTEKYPNYHISVYTIINEFFGERITVSGLITGTDLKKQLKDKDLGERLLLTSSMLRSGENVFLDDITVEELEETLQVSIDIVESSGQDLVESILHETDNHIRKM